MDSLLLLSELVEAQTAMLILDDATYIPSLDVKEGEIVGLKRKNGPFTIISPASKIRKVDSNDSIASSYRSLYGSGVEDSHSIEEAGSEPNVPEIGSDDDDDDLSSYGGKKSRAGAGAGNNKRSREEAKVLHRAIERKRTQRITEAIFLLKDQLELHNRSTDKDSKSEILLAAIHHVIEMQDILREHCATTGYTPRYVSVMENTSSVLDAYKESNYSSQVNVQGSSKEDKRRALHRAVERRRTNRINDHINQMKMVLQSDDEDRKVINDKSNKSTILSRFLTYMKRIHEEVVNIPAALEAISKPAKFFDNLGKFVSQQLTSLPCAPRLSLGSEDYIPTLSPAMLPSTPQAADSTPLHTAIANIQLTATTDDDNDTRSL